METAHRTDGQGGPRTLATVASVILMSQLGAVPGHAKPADPWTDSARYRFEYRVDFSTMKVPDDARLRVWVPYPADTGHQRVLSATVESPWAHTLASDWHGNRVLYMEGRGAPARDLVMQFTFERQPSDGIPASQIRPESPLDPERHIYAARLIPLEGIIQQVATKEGVGARTDAEKARALYDYVVKNMRYDKQGTGWGRGDAIWACDHKRGNCTDFHSLFIGMARSQGIPARFVIGFLMPANTEAGPIGGYHCWADYYEDGRGWVPVDASEASKSGKGEAYFGRIPNDRIEFTVGRDLVLEPGQNGPPLNFFIYPYAEADGKLVPQEELRATFRFERLGDSASTD